MQKREKTIERGKKKKREKENNQVESHDAGKKRNGERKGEGKRGELKLTYLHRKNKKETQKSRLYKNEKETFKRFFSNTRQDGVREKHYKIAHAIS